MMSDGTFETLAKRERLQVTRQRPRWKNLDLCDHNRLPSAIFMLIFKRDERRKEATRLNIPIIAMVDTCCVQPIDYVIPSSDDAAKSFYRWYH